MADLIALVDFRFRDLSLIFRGEARHDEPPLGGYRIVQVVGFSGMLGRSGLVLAALSIAASASNAQSVDDPLDDPIDCSTGEPAAGLLPAVADIISIDIRKLNEDLVATVEFRGDPAFGDSVSGGIVALDPEGLPPGSGSDWHFDNAGNVLFSYAGDGLSTGTMKFVADSIGAWMPDTTTAFTAMRAGNIVIITIPADELGPGSLWMAFVTTRLFEMVPRCDAAGNDKDGFPLLEVPTLIASGDGYEAAGNVGISVPANEGLLVNDIDADSIVAYDEMSEGGGTVVVDAEGGFTFSPAAGFFGSDSFSYTIDDGKGGIASADVIVDVGPAIWFVDAGAGEGPGTGTWSDPFTTLTSLSLVTGTPYGPKPNDAIAILGDGEYASELVLDSNQVVVGQGVDILQTLQTEGFNLPQFSEVLASPPPLANPPVLVSDSLDAVTLGLHNRIFGITVGDTPGGSAIKGDSVATLQISSVAIGGRGGLLDIAKGEIEISLESAASDSAAVDAVSLKDVVGMFTVATPVVIRSPGRDGISTAGGSVTLDFPGLEILGADSGYAVEMDATAINDSRMGDVRVVSTSGYGLAIAGNGALQITGGIVRSGRSAMDLRSVTIDASLDTLKSARDFGVRLDSVSGSILVGYLEVDSTKSHSVDVRASSVLLAAGEMHIGAADSSFAVYIENSPGSVLRSGSLTVNNPTGGGLNVDNADSVRIDAGTITSVGYGAMFLRDVAAAVTLESVVVDSADVGVMLENVGGLVVIVGDGTAGSGGRISGASQRGLNARNVSEIQLTDVDVEQTVSDAVHLMNFGSATLSGLRIQGSDSTGISANIGGRLEVTGSSISDVLTGIAAYEIDHVILEANGISGTDSTAVIVSNLSSAETPSATPKRTDGDVVATLIGNEIETQAEEGIHVSSAVAGSTVLDLRANRSMAGVDDFVLTAVDPAVLMLVGYAGGSESAAVEYVRRSNPGAVNIRVEGMVSAGPTGPSDVATLEKTVSDNQPLPEREIEYSMTITNLGPAPAIEVTLTDSLPEGLAYLPETTTVDGVLMTDDDDDDPADFGVSNENTLTVRLGDLSVGDTVVVTLGARPRQAVAGVTLTNTAQIATMSPDPVLANNEASVEISIKLNTGVEDESLPSEFALHQNYPNPFNPVTTIGFDLPQRASVRLTVLNVLGQAVTELVGAELEAGRYEVRWEGRTAAGAPTPSGLYFYRLEAGARRATGTMMLLR